MMSLSASLPTSLSASLRSRKRGRESEDSADGKLRAATPPPSPAPAVPRGLPLDPLVKRLYSVVNDRSFLQWGLTSDFEVGARRRTSPPPAPPALDGPPAPAPAKDRNAASEGYGEMTAGSVERLLVHLKALRARAVVSKSGRRVKLTPSHDLGAASTFLDVGSGYGKVVFHAALSGGCARSSGLEYVPARSAVASSILHDLRSGKLTTKMGGVAKTALVARLRGCELACGDATEVELGASHVYIYDKVFSERTSEGVAARLAASGALRVVVSYRTPAAWAKWGLRLQQVGSIAMNTTGGQKFTAFICVPAR